METNFYNCSERGNRALEKITLQIGDKGEPVVELQRLLNSQGSHLNEDGEFTSAVLTAVVNYQRSRGLTIDGIVGRETWYALKQHPIMP